MNIATGFIEIPKNIINISSDQNIFVGATWGTLRGFTHAVGRTVVGAGELITSPIPTEDYISPPYVSGIVLARIPDISEFICLGFGQLMVRWTTARNKFLKPVGLESSSFPL
jgi:putative exosortase-associated protein (TIGR04073 family)